mmetsp:Transcript_16376/g.28624  ORF Transcript_16376/g.28624 Transcript_16376/m.28624 type:complete len:623 (-) Transcript_16376:93-1961(-)|eukprot:CAMPEP_0171502664 /NCGR_PEP_ID=MMETSP0958-20121227/10326_1 /TAXON_ID=87120 /ORGANISM="Aurantiochytrium limacinum, Strain ATCCMYA-1381" /LENGTH=622 /DNA_ID=CAMNT_0012037789 /DNA_START=148 /DNA_END=2016 /DNA_ORIENTATION=-
MEDIGPAAVVEDQATRIMEMKKTRVYEEMHRRATERKASREFEEEQQRRLQEMKEEKHDAEAECKVSQRNKPGKLVAAGKNELQLERDTRRRAASLAKQAAAEERLRAALEIMRDEIVANEMRQIHQLHTKMIFEEERTRSLSRVLEERTRDTCQRKKNETRNLVSTDLEHKKRVLEIERKTVIEDFAQRKRTASIEYIAKLEQNRQVTDEQKAAILATANRVAESALNQVRFTMQQKKDMNRAAQEWSLERGRLEAAKDSSIAVKDSMQIIESAPEQGDTKSNSKGIWQSPEQAAILDEHHRMDISGALGKLALDQAQPEASKYSRGTAGTTMNENHEEGLGKSLEKIGQEEATMLANFDIKVEELERALETKREEMEASLERAITSELVDKLSEMERERRAHEEEYLNAVTRVQNNAQAALAKLEIEFEQRRRLQAAAIEEEEVRQERLENQANAYRGASLEQAERVQANKAAEAAEAQEASRNSAILRSQAVKDSENERVRRMSEDPNTEDRITHKKRLSLVNQSLQNAIAPQAGVVYNPQTQRGTVSASSETSTVSEADKSQEATANGDSEKKATRTCKRPRLRILFRPKSHRVKRDSSSLSSSSQKFSNKQKSCCVQ